MRSLSAYVVLLVAVACAPTFRGAVEAQPVEGPFPGWPDRFLAEDMDALPLEPAEERFAANFPGRIAKFQDGPRRYIVRYVTRPTRLLHPAEDCFRAMGYAVTHEPHCPSGPGPCLVATRGAERLLLQEQIADTEGQVFDDVSSWYWATLRDQSRGPWWSITSIRRAPGGKGAVP